MLNAPARSDLQLTLTIIHAGHVPPDLNHTFDALGKLIQLGLIVLVRSSLFLSPIFLIDPPFASELMSHDSLYRVCGHLLAGYPLRYRECQNS